MSSRLSAIEEEMEKELSTGERVKAPNSGRRHLQRGLDSCDVRLAEQEEQQPIKVIENAAGECVCVRVCCEQCIFNQHYLDRNFERKMV